MRQIEAFHVGVALNTSRFNAAAARQLCEQIEDELDLPCEDPIAMGVGNIVGRLLECFQDSVSAVSATGSLTA